MCNCKYAAASALRYYDQMITVRAARLMAGQLDVGHGGSVGPCQLITLNSCLQAPYPLAVDSIMKQQIYSCRSSLHATAVVLEEQ